MIGYVARFKEVTFNLTCQEVGREGVRAIERARMEGVVEGAGRGNSVGEGVVNGDALRFTQALTNVLSNALKVVCTFSDGNFKR